MGAMYEPQNNGPHTLLDATINDSQTSITVADATILPAAPNVLTIGTEEDAELVLVESKTGNILTVQRGFNGTTPKAWDAETWIYRAITAQDIQELQKRAGYIVYDLTADELTAMDTAARAALYADGARVLKVTNGETVVLLTLNAEGTTQWAGGEMPRNLLDNSYFAGPIVDGVKQGLVNQRGQTSYTGKENYTVDRWFIGASNTEVTIDESRVTATVTTGTAFPSLVQKVKNASRLAGKTLTFAARVYSNTTPTIRVQRNDIYLSYADGAALVDGVLVTTVVVPDDISDGELSVRAFARTVATLDYINIYWAALYEGSYTADTLPPYVPKGYGAELAECQRYYYVFGSTAPHIILGNGYATTTTNVRILATTPQCFRVRPSMETVDVSKLFAYCQGKAITPTGIEIYERSGNNLTFNVTVSEVTTNYPAFVKLNGTTIALSADL